MSSAQTPEWEVTIYYRTQAGGNSWSGKVCADSEDDAYEAGKRVMHKQRPSCRHCQVDGGDVIPAAPSEPEGAALDNEPSERDPANSPRAG